MKMTQEERVFALEALVDSETLRDVLIALHLVCLEKAEHLRVNWQDKITASVWDRAGAAIRRAAEHSTVETVS